MITIPSNISIHYQPIRFFDLPKYNTRREFIKRQYVQDVICALNKLNYNPINIF